MLVELLNTSAAAALVGVLGALAGVVLGWGLRRLGDTQCIFTDWHFVVQKGRTPDGYGGYTSDGAFVTPDSPNEDFTSAHGYDLRVGFRLFNERELPTGLSEARIYFLKGGSVLTHTSVLELRKYQEDKPLSRRSVTLPSREWVEISTQTGHVQEGAKLTGFDGAELRAKYPGSDKEDFRKRVPKAMLIPRENSRS